MNYNLTISEVIEQIKGGGLLCIEVEDYLTHKPTYRSDFESAVENEDIVSSMYGGSDTYLKIFIEEYNKRGYGNGIFKMPKTTPQTPNKGDVGAFTLPTELDTAEARKLLQEAIEAEFMSNGYQWQRDIQLAAYFACKASEYLKLTTKLDGNGSLTTLWKPFNVLFGYDAKKNPLKGAKQNWMRLNTKFTPPGYDEIDRLFE